MHPGAEEEIRQEGEKLQGQVRVRPIRIAHHDHKETHIGAQALLLFAPSMREEDQASDARLPVLQGVGLQDRAAMRKSSHEPSRRARRGRRAFPRQEDQKVGRAPLTTRALTAASPEASLRPDSGCASP